LTKYSRPFFSIAVVIIQILPIESHALDAYAALKNQPALSNISFKNPPQNPNSSKESNIINSIKSNINHFNSTGNSASTPPKKKIIPSQKPVISKNSILINLTVESVQDKPIYHLKFQGGIPFYAVFFHENSWYIAFSYPSTLVITNKTLKNIPNLQSVHHFSDDQGFLLKLTMDKKLYPRITFKKEANTIILKFVSTPPTIEQCQEITPSISTENVLQIRLPHGHLDQDFYDEDENIQFWVVTAEPNKSNSAYFHEHTFPQFTLLESYEGLGMLTYNDELRTEFSHKEARIENPHHHHLSLERQEELPPPPYSIFQNFEESEAPARLATVNKRALTKEAALSEYIESAWIYIGLGKTAEAMSVLKRLKERAGELSLLPAFRTLDGLSQLLLGRGEQAEEILKPIPNDSEITFFKNIAHFITRGTVMKSDDIHHDENKSEVSNAPPPLGSAKQLDWLSFNIIKTKDQLLSLPSPLYNILLSQLLQVCLVHKNVELLSFLTKKDFKPRNISPGTYLDSYALYKLAQVIVTINTKHQNVKNNIKNLNDFLKFYMNHHHLFHCQLEYLQLLQHNNKIDLKTELKELENLRFQWRGDLLEYKINTYLADRYIEEKIYHRALPLLRKTLNYFPHNGKQDKLAEKMQNALISYFKQNPPPPLMQSLSVFQEFGDILPDNETGDDVMLLATNLLIKLKLYSISQEILNKYIKDKVKTGDRQYRKNHLLFQMALSYYLDDKTHEVFDALNNTQHVLPTLGLKINLLKSLTYEKMEMTENALSVLGNSNPELYQQAKIQFSEANWDEAAAIYQGILDSKESKKSAPEERQHLVINLALCHKLCCNHEELIKIHKEYKDMFKKQKNEPTFMFLTKELVPQNNKGKINIKTDENYVDNIKKVFLHRHNILENYLLPK